MTTVAETNRLILRRFDILDAQAFYKLNANTKVLKYTGDKAFKDVHEAEKFIREYDEYLKNDFGRWTVVNKRLNEVVGWCGLKQNEEKQIDLGFRFFEEEWGKGFATESANAALDLGFKKYKLKEIIGRAARENKASIKVLEKLGMQYFKIGNCDGIGNSLYYKISAVDYL